MIPPKPRHWASPAPTTCDVCLSPLLTSFIDGATQGGQWGIMCPRCHLDHGIGLGPGRGQRYTDTGTKWVKVGG